MCVAYLMPKVESVHRARTPLMVIMIDGGRASSKVVTYQHGHIQYTLQHSADDEGGRRESNHTPREVSAAPSQVAGGCTCTSPSSRAAAQSTVVREGAVGDLCDGLRHSHNLCRV